MSKRNPGSSYNRVKKFRHIHVDKSQALAESTPEDLDESHAEPTLDDEPLGECFEEQFIECDEEQCDESEEQLPTVVHQSVETSDSEGSDESSDPDSDEGGFYSYDSMSASDSSFEDEEEPEHEVHQNPIEDLKSKLRLWSLQNAISLKALSQLLVLIAAWLSTYCGFLAAWLPTFPKDARTLLQTNAKKHKVQEMLSHGGTPGEFVYFGIAEGLSQQVQSKFFPVPEICLSFNVDGIPLFKSSSIGFWCILCKICDKVFEWRPFSVAIYSGPGKPGSVRDFLKDFVQEVTDLLQNGVTIGGRHYTVNVRCYICDTPARSFIKCIIGHGGFFSCERCIVKGETVNKRRIYPQKNCDLRTEQSFISKDQEEHHVGTTPLLEIPHFKPITSFILDYMHLICLGVMKRLLHFYWIPVTKKIKDISSSPQQTRLLTARLAELRKHITAEFPRKLRAAQNAVHFKATELRFFLLYSGPIALKGILSTQLYKHFLLLHVATRLLCCPLKATTYTQYAKSLYQHFFSTLPQLYGKDSQINNMHNLIHLADDVENMQCCLDEMSAFPFENALGKIKRMLRSYSKPLAQYCKRKTELEGITQLPVRRCKVKTSIRTTRDRGVMVQYKSFIISASEPDNFILLNDDQIVEVTEICEDPAEKIKISGRVWRHKRSFFTFPCESAKLNEWEISDPSNHESVWSLRDVKSKLVRFQLVDGDRTRDYAIAVLHSSV